ncbi:MAG: hypothetical protein K0S61_116 [Anaerocolumna sp.]|jgi:hypothetical protein|nr:hypothetical protein [Anaerocolumna sp.]
MDKSFDLLVEDTKALLIKDLNESGLPITVMLMILKELTGEVAEQTRATITKQRLEVNNIGNK